MGQISPTKYSFLKKLLQYKGMILDFDGLIADSEPFHFKAYDTVFRKYGHALDPDEYWIEWTSKGNGIAGEIDRHNLQLTVNPKEIRQQKFELYSKFCRSGEINLFPGVTSFVQNAAKKFRLAIASGSWGHDIRAILNNSGSEDLFPVILGKESASREKPHPDIFFEAAKKLKLEASECVVVEDALKGLKAAKAAGMACGIVQNRLNSKIKFDEADWVADSLHTFTSKLSLQ